MNSQKLITGGIVGGIALFLLGWVFFGILLKDFFADNGSPASANMVWWALALGNLLLGFLLAYVLSKANIRSAGTGAATGLVVGLLMSAGFNLIRYAVSVEIIAKKVIAADVAAITVMWTIAGAIVGWVLGSGKRVAVV